MKVSLESLQEFAQETLGRIQPNTDKAFLLFLSGNLGSGKTTFMQALARGLGVEGQVQSPTFVLMKKYDLNEKKAKPFNLKGLAFFSTLIHIDAYRLENGPEFDALQPEEFLNDPYNIVCIEWAENIHDVLPKPDLVIKFSSEGMKEGEREIEIQ